MDRTSKNVSNDGAITNLVTDCFPTNYENLAATTTIVGKNQGEKKANHKRFRFSNSSSLMLCPKEAKKDVGFGGFSITSTII